MSVADNYPPTKAIIDEAVINFKEEAAEKNYFIRRCSKKYG